jgi:hypothetical protein
MLVIIQFMGIVSNFIYILISNYISPDPAFAATFGFARKYLILINGIPDKG